jgi:hypothetical protein
MGSLEMVHGSLKPLIQVERRGLTVVNPRLIVSVKSFSEDQLESVLNLPVADVTGRVGQTEGWTGCGTRTAIDNTVSDCSASKRGIQVLTGESEHGVIHQIKELHAELNA